MSAKMLIKVPAKNSLKKYFNIFVIFNTRAFEKAGKNIFNFLFVQKGQMPP